MRHFAGAAKGCLAFQRFVEGVSAGLEAGSHSFLSTLMREVGVWLSASAKNACLNEALVVCGSASPCDSTFWRTRQSVSFWVWHRMSDCLPSGCVLRQVSSVGCGGHSVENAVTWLQAANTQQRCIYLIQTEKMPNLLDRAGDLIAVWQCDFASTTNLLPWTHRTVQADCMLVVAHILAWDGLGGTPIVLLGPTGRIEQEGRIPCVEGNH